jgi:hypothetical protein
MQKRKSIKLFFFIVIINMYLEDKNKTTWLYLEHWKQTFCFQHCHSQETPENLLRKAVSHI